MAYPYRSPRFTRLVADSYGTEDPRQFYRWLESAYRSCRVQFPGKEHLGLSELLQRQREALTRLQSPPRRAQAETATAAWLHRAVKAMIPRFSLERGFEFRNVVRYGERQCLLQSVLIAGLLQAMGMDAGVLMVCRNAHGQESNNGHVVALVKLADGRDLLVDASEQTPFPRQQGLLARCPAYCYVQPVYAHASPFVVAYRSERDGTPVATARVWPLGFAFVRSQFAYYRGERAHGGLLAPSPTSSGLETTAQHLRAAVRLCPDNALAVYMLARTCLLQGKTLESRHLARRALDLYTAFGWVPSGPEELYRRLSVEPHAGSGGLSR